MPHLVCVLELIDWWADEIACHRTDHKSSPTAGPDLADNDSFGHTAMMTWRPIIIGIAGLLIGWSVRYYLDTDACLDAGGRWEARGGYCFGARPAD